MTAAANDLTTLAVMKGYLTTPTNDDVLLQRLITAASTAILSYINRDIKTASYSDVFDGTGGRVMVLPQYPITAVASVTINGTVIPVGSVSVAGFYFTKDKIVLNSYIFAKGNANVAIAWTAGFATVPSDLEQFCIGTVQYWMGDRQRNGESSRTMGGQTITYTTDDMPKWVKTGLNQLRNVVPI